MRGVLILQTNLLMDYPFRGINKPMNPYHVREYTPRGLERLLGRQFEIIGRWAVVQEWYTDITRARNVAMYLARKV